MSCGCRSTRIIVLFSLALSACRATVLESHLPEAAPEHVSRAGGQAAKLTRHETFHGCYGQEALRNLSAFRSGLFKTMVKPGTTMT